MALGSRVTCKNGVRKVLDELESQLEVSDAAYAHAQWRRHFGLSDPDELSELASTRTSILADDQARATLRRWENRLDDPILARRVTMLLRRAQWDDVEFHPQVVRLRNRIDAVNARHRFRVNGFFLTRGERLALLRQDASCERRRQAWLSTRGASDLVEGDVRQLLRLRQRLVRSQGFESYPAWAMNAMGLDPLWIEALFAELRRSTEHDYRDWLSEAARVLKPLDGLRPWDLTFFAERAMALPEWAFPRHDAVAAAMATARVMGLGHTSKRVRVDMAALPHTALCYAIHPPRDVRIIVDSRDGFAHYATVFHEFGHALHWRSLRPESPVLRHEPAPFNESMACLWARFVYEPDWLLARGALVQDQVPQYRRASARRSIFRLRWHMAQATFERMAYESPDGDLNGLWCDVFGQFLGVPCDPAPGWAHSLFWSSHPVYVQNYVIGELVASQTLKELRYQFGSLDGKEVGAWLTTHYFEPGASVPWRDKVVNATGAALSADALLAELSAGGSI